MHGLVVACVRRRWHCAGIGLARALLYLMASALGVVLALAMLSCVLVVVRARCRACSLSCVFVAMRARCRACSLPCMFIVAHVCCCARSCYVHVGAVAQAAVHLFMIVLSVLLVGQLSRCSSSRSCTVGRFMAGCDGGDVAVGAAHIVASRLGDFVVVVGAVRRSWLAP